MSVADQIRRIKNAKAAIKEAIINKGVAIGDDVKLDEYHRYINNIEAGSGSDNDYAWPDFWELRTKVGGSCQYLFAYVTIYESDIRYKEMIENFNVPKGAWFNEMFKNFNNPNTSIIAPTGAIKELDLTKWDVSQAAFFTQMFDNCILDYLDISGWDFSGFSGSSYLQLFYGTNIKEINMANCNIGHITSHYRLCYQAYNLVTINMTGCDTSKATSMNGMFGYCSNLITITGEIDASSLTNGFYSSGSTNPFSNCSSLETLYLKNIYKDCAVTNASKFSIDLGATKVKDECLVYIIDQLPNLADKGITNNTAIKLTLPTVNTLTDEQKQVALDKGWIVVN